MYLYLFIYLFFRICYTDSIGVQEDQYPPNIAVKVNQSYCHVPVSRFISRLRIWLLGNSRLRKLRNYICCLPTIWFWIPALDSNAYGRMIYFYNLVCGILRFVINYRFPGGKKLLLFQNTKLLFLGYIFLHIFCAPLLIFSLLLPTSPGLLSFQ